VTLRLEPQRHRIGGAAEDRYRERIGQADADGADAVSSSLSPTESLRNFCM
jgi:hypothetical protein